MYRAAFATIGGTTKVGLWRPRLVVADAPTALLLGRSPENWYGADPSDQARLLVDAGYWVVTADTPNWGNATDMASINSVLSWLETNWGRSTDRLLVVAHNAGCISALNWGMRHHDRVASMSLLSPIIDLQERFSRVVADQASMAAAYGGSNALVLPGTNGNYASTPDHVSLDITSDLDLRAEIAATDWTPASNRSIISKYVTAGNQRSYRLRLLTTGRLELVWTADGVTQRNATSTASPTVTDGSVLAVRATLDVDNNAGSRVVTFYTAPTISGTWTQLGDPVTTAGTTSIFSGTGALEVGSVATGVETFQGSIYKVEVRNGINGTVVANPDFSAQTAGTTSFADATGKTWTLQGTAAISSAFANAMRTWNPGYTPHRRYIVADMLGDRLKMWWAASDTQTPPAVTAALAAAFGADTGTLSNQDPVLVDPAPIIADAVAIDTAWFNQPAHREMQKWHTYVETSVSFAEYKGGDACTTTILPDGRWATTFADSFLTNLSPAVPTGTDVSDGTYLATFGPTRNMLVLHDSAGAITGQIYSGPPGNNPPLVPNQTTYPNHWYWPIDKIVDNGALQVACWLVNLDSGTFGHIVDSHIVTLDPTTLAQTAATPLNVGEIFSAYGLLSDGGFIYVLGQEYVGGYDNYDIDTVTQTRIARVPVGQLTTRASWEFRTASGWSSASGDAVPIVDSTLANLVGDSTITKSGSTFILAAFGPTEGAVRIYSSPDPWGPWTLYHTTPIQQLGAARYTNAMAVGYHPKWHPHLNTGGRLMLGWNGNFFSTGSPNSPWDDIDHFYFAPHFLLIPPP